MPVSKKVARAGRGGRKEHMTWCKERALEYLPHDPAGAVASMTSDLNKHPETGGEVYAMLAMAGIMEIQRGSEAVRRWVEGFN